MVQKLLTYGEGLHQNTLRKMREWYAALDTMTFLVEGLVGSAVSMWFEHKYVHIDPVHQIIFRMVYNLPLIGFGLLGLLTWVNEFYRGKIHGSADIFVRQVLADTATLVTYRFPFYVLGLCVIAVPFADGVKASAVFISSSCITSWIYTLLRNHYHAGLSEVSEEIDNGLSG